MFTKRCSIVIFLFLTFVINAQVKTDTVTFTLHCLENEIEVEENLSKQLDSIYDVLKFHDSTLTAEILQVIVFGHTDTKGSKRSNQNLSEKRANYVAHSIRNVDSFSNDVVLGFGEEKPVASNKTADGRAQNRRVEVTLLYYQTKRKPRVEIPSPLTPLRVDTAILFEDSAVLAISLDDYKLVKNSIAYKRHTNLFELFETLGENDAYDTFYNFNSITLRWDSVENKLCLKHEVTLSVKVPDVLVNQSMKELKAYTKKFKGQKTRLVKHADGKWYLDISTYCPFYMIGCGFKGKFIEREDPKLVKVKYVSKNGYKIVGAFMEQANYFYYKKLKAPKNKIKLRVACHYELPKVSVITLREGNIDTLYLAEGTEENIDHKRHCKKCDVKEIIKGKPQEPITKKSLVRKKYIFREKDFRKKVVRKIKK